MQVNFPREERKRIMSSQFVYGLHKNSHEEFSLHGRCSDGKEMNKKYTARAKLLFC